MLVLIGRLEGMHMLPQQVNPQGGGTRDTKDHYDVPMRDCTVILDGDVIIDQGKFVDKKMIVERVER